MSQQVDIRIVRRNDPPPFAELAEKEAVETGITRMCVLEGGMKSGKASVVLLADLPNGAVAFMEMSADMLESLAAAARGARQSWGELP